MDRVQVLGAPPRAEIYYNGGESDLRLKFRVSFETDEGLRFFGEGPYRLLKAIEAHHSLRAGAQSMGMAYTKAFHIIQNAEREMGFQLIQRSIGGKGGGGSTLTPQAQELVERYGAYREACDKLAEQLYREYFDDFLTEAASIYQRRGKGQPLDRSEPVGAPEKI